MQRKHFLILLLLGVTIPLPLIYSACSAPVKFDPADQLSSKNTIAGNPLHTKTYQLLSGICGAISRCHPTAVQENCLSQWSDLQGLNVPLHLPSEFSTLDSLYRGEYSGTLVSEATTVTACTQSLEQLDCNSTELQSAYNATLENPYLGATNLLSAGSCNTVLEFVNGYTCAKRILAVNSPANKPMVPKETASGVTYSISPPLPAGLQLDSQTGVISGTPQNPFPATDFTVSAQQGSKTSTTVINLTGAEGYVVDDLGDDSNLASVNCATASGKCTLRAALEAANAATTAKVVLLPSGQINLSQQKPLTINKGTEVYGDCELGTTVDGQSKTNVIEITAGPTILDHLTIQNGSTLDKGGAGVSIDAYNGTYHTLLSHVTITKNSNVGGNSGMSIGAGIAVFGKDSTSIAQVTMDYCTISENTNTNGNFGSGIGLWYNTDVTIKHSSIINNWSSSYGGGLSTHSGNLKVIQSLFANNKSEGVGGAIFVDQFAENNSLIENSTFSNNESTRGGAIYLGKTTMTITNSTFYANNSTDTGYAGALLPQASNFIFQNNLFVKNTSTLSSNQNCQDSSTAYTSLGGNVSDTNSSDCSFNQSTDLISSGLDLSPLQDHGGPTFTHALLANSLAVSRGVASACPLEDQRGALRPTGQACDSGAFQLSK